MKSLLVTILDKKAETHNGLHQVPNLAVAIRMMGDTVAEGDSLMSKHPEDYCLVEVGTFDSETGLIEPTPHGPRLVIEAAAVVRNNKEA